MAKTLLEYADWLGERNLKWPAPPKRESANATPSLKPIEGIRAVTWSVYGTLLRITDGELLLQHPQTIRMEVAIEKTIHEFNMWNSMVRRMGKPSDAMLPKYIDILEEAYLRSVNRKGDKTELDSSVIWRSLIDLLSRKEYRYDESFYGDLDELSQKVAYFFHSSLQGVEASSDALFTISSINDAGLRQGALDNGQSFTLTQLTRALRTQDALPDVRRFLPDSLNTFSYEYGVRKPSVTLYAAAIEKFHAAGIEPHQIMHVGTRMVDDLAAAKAFGFRTVLYAGEKPSLQATAEDFKNPATRPDRLITQLPQLRDILQI